MNIVSSMLRPTLSPTRSQCGGCSEHTSISFMTSSTLPIYHIRSSIHICIRPSICDSRLLPSYDRRMLRRTLPLRCFMHMNVH
jgi:hypothetical protein